MNDLMRAIEGLAQQSAATSLNTGSAIDLLQRAIPMLAASVGTMSAFQELVGMLAAKGYLSDEEVIKLRDLAQSPIDEVSAPIADPET